MNVGDIGGGVTLAGLFMMAVSLLIMIFLHVPQAIVELVGAYFAALRTEPLPVFFITGLLVAVLGAWLMLIGEVDA